MLAVASDLMLRGRSISDGQPTASLAFEFAARPGVYGGVELVGTWPRGASARFLGVVAQLGFARPIGPALAVEAGITQRAYSQAYTPGFAADFVELYGGLSRGAVAARIAWSPDYFGRGAQTLYLEAETAQPLGPATRATLRGGVLAVMVPPAPPAQLRARWDVRTGIGHDLGRLTLEAAIHAVGPTPDPLRDGTERRVTATLGARLAF